MKQKYGKAFLVLNFAIQCLALPTSVENYPNPEGNTEGPCNIEKQSNRLAETERRIEEDHNATGIEWGKKEKLLVNIENFNTDKESIADIRDKQNSEEIKDFEEDFLSLEHHIPDLTDDEYDEINKEGATPWNFLKTLDNKKHAKDNIPDTLHNITPIYITIPIVINSDTSLPIALTIGGKGIPLQVANGATSPASLIQKKDYRETPIRETNRHRSSMHKSIYARNKSQKIK